MASQRLVNFCLMSSVKSAMSAISSSDAEIRGLFFDKFLVDKADVRIKALFRDRSEDLHPFSDSIFAYPVSDDEELHHKNIGNGVLRQAATYFYGCNRFIADDLADLSRFANAIEPECQQYVKAIVLTDGMFVANHAGRISHHLRPEDYDLIQVLRRFPRLQAIVFSFTWEAAGNALDRVIDAICFETRSLESIQIQRPMQSRMGYREADSALRVKDARLQKAVNEVLADRRLFGGPNAH